MTAFSPLRIFQRQWGNSQRFFYHIARKMLALIASPALKIRTLQRSVHWLLVWDLACVSISMHRTIQGEPAVGIIYEGFYPGLGFLQGAGYSA